MYTGTDQGFGFSLTSLGWAEERSGNSELQIKEQHQDQGIEAPIGSATQGLGERDSLIVKKHELSLLRAAQNPPPKDLVEKYDGSKYVDEDTLTNQDYLVRSMYLDRAKVWADNHLDHCSREVWGGGNRGYRNSISVPNPGSIVLHKTVYSHQLGLLAERYCLDIYHNPHLDHLEAIGEGYCINKKTMEMKTILCFNVNDHYDYLRLKDVYERLFFLVTICKSH
ncbi:hypothetical protein BKA70DRAFT_1402717 [Coprinopsis sp. MPI-PUGE-AT-0042]|nr:hypothetical protein BKA70DRAFT_1402717 [Coprinopsis sp. MPI-PUGE-AT-0042]